MEDIKQKRKEYYKLNRDHILKYSKINYQENKDKYKLYNHNYYMNVRKEKIKKERNDKNDKNDKNDNNEHLENTKQKKYKKSKNTNKINFNLDDKNTFKIIFD